MRSFDLEFRYEGMFSLTIQLESERIVFGTKTCLVELAILLLA